MDIVLLRTFLELNRTRHFGKAADNLFITQSTMSARIRQLEEILGVTLFTRVRNNIQLTAAGQKLIRHAESILAAWERTRMDVALQEEQKDYLTIAGMFSLWDILLQDWLHSVHRNLPEIALRTDAMRSEDVQRGLLESRVDLGFVFEPAQYNEFTLHELPPAELILVASRPDLTLAEALAAHYVKVDWGTSFAITHSKTFPDAPTPALHMSMGRNALAFILACGGQAFLARSMVEPHLQRGELYPVTGSPVIRRSCYAVYRTDTTKQDLIEKTLKHFHAE